MYHIIINRTAASGQCEKSWKKLSTILLQKGVAHEAHLTESPEDTARIVSRLTSGKNDVHLILLGGDGTLNLVLQSIVSFSRTKISVIPIGSGNDFARDMGISKNPEKALFKILQHPKESILDYGILTYKEKNSQDIESRKFLISCGTGFDAAICHNVNSGRLKKLLNQMHLGKISYLLTGVALLFSGTASPATLTLDGQTEIHVPLFLSASMIHRYEGGGVAFAPDADPSDGLFHVCAVEDMKPLLRIRALIRVLLKKHISLPTVHYQTCRTLSSRFDSPVWCHTDGEVPGEITECTMTCRSGLRLVH